MEKLPFTAEVKRTGFEIGLQVQNWLFTSPSRRRRCVFFLKEFCACTARGLPTAVRSQRDRLYGHFFLSPNTKAIHMTHVIINLIHVQRFYQPNYNE